MTKKQSKLKTQFAIIFDCSSGVIGNSLTECRINREIQKFLSPFPKHIGLHQAHLEIKIPQLLSSLSFLFSSMKSIMLPQIPELPDLKRWNNNENRVL